MFYQYFLHMEQHCYVARFVIEYLSSLSLDKLVFSREDIKTEYCLPLGSDYLNRQSATFNERKSAIRTFYLSINKKRFHRKSYLLQKQNQNHVLLR